MGSRCSWIETQEPKEVLNGGGLQPLGGSEASGGYKGTGLCMMVEVLCGIMAGSSFGKSIRTWRTSTGILNLGQCFVAIEPDCFAPQFNDRLACFLAETRELNPEKLANDLDVQIFKAKKISVSDREDGRSTADHGLQVQ
ncbi:hypothetical protein KIN20_033875 [Parelaphostrongylus tenuis]|uniref:Malate dehydrogenase n=1 Tax=Parelaphostrongylus tenuis TaxID=148309 RepID=A0AAD5R950_PARTN|nr:hypothetical protein KIN20_033875 [Parelaphostrongylus tenuis]